MNTNGTGWDGPNLSGRERERDAEGGEREKPIFFFNHRPPPPLGAAPRPPFPVLPAKTASSATADKHFVE